MKIVKLHGRPLSLSTKLFVGAEEGRLQRLAKAMASCSVKWVRGVVPSVTSGIRAENLWLMSGAEIQKFVDDCASLTKDNPDAEEMTLLAVAVQGGIPDELITGETVVENLFRFNHQIPNMIELVVTETTDCDETVCFVTNPVPTSCATLLAETGFYSVAYANGSHGKHALQSMFSLSSERISHNWLDGMLDLGRY